MKQSLFLLLFVAIFCNELRAIDVKDYTVVGRNERVTIQVPIVSGEKTRLVLEAKVDTGAQTSSLNAVDIHEFKKNGEHYVKFKVPTPKGVLEAEAPLAKEGTVKSSDGNAAERYFIELPLRLGNQNYQVLVSLSDRTKLKFPMLLGRELLKRHFLVDCSREYLLQ